MNRRFSFAEGELDDAACPRCGGSLDVTTVQNDEGDWVQFAFCPSCVANKTTRCIRLPETLTKGQA